MLVARSSWLAARGSKLLWKTIHNSLTAKPGHISHSYTDHVSILKFIEANWKLSPLTSRSRDNFPNPKTSRSNPYVPTNSPALGDLMDLFNFNRN